MNPWPFIASAALCWLLCWPVYRFLIAGNIIDRPNERSSHTRPTARGGGIAIMAAVALGAFCLAWSHQVKLLWVLPLLALVLAAVSFVDDLRAVPPAIRFGCHAGAALAALLVLQPRFDFPDWVNPTVAAFASCAVLFLWIAGYTNAFNFMDGINGIAGVQAFATGLGMALIAHRGAAGEGTAPILFCAVLAGAGLGFLPHNFPKARMFMGDVSSAPLGFLLAFAAVWLSAELGWDLLLPLTLMHTNFVLDTAITLSRRVLRGEKWYLPHREHFYQRFVRAGKSHSFVTLWELALQLLTFLLLMVYMRSSLEGKVGTTVAVLLLWSTFFICAEAAFRKRTNSNANTQQPPAL